MGSNDAILVLGYDQAVGKDISVLHVAKVKTDGSMDVINEFKGEEAERIYQMLILKGEKK